VDWELQNGHCKLQIANWERAGDGVAGARWFNFLSLWKLWDLWGNMKCMGVFSRDLHRSQERHAWNVWERFGIYGVFLQDLHRSQARRPPSISNLQMADFQFAIPLPRRKVSSVRMSARILVQRRMGDLRSAACGSVGRPATTARRGIENWPLKIANCKLISCGPRPPSISNLQWLIFNLQFAIPISSIPR